MSGLSTLSGREALRWGAAALVVAGLHATGVWYAQPGPSEALTLAGDPTVQMIDLAPAMVENEPIGAEAAPAVETAEAVTEMTVAEEVVTEVEPVGEPVVETQVTERVQPAQPVEELAVEEEVAEAEIVVPKKVEKPKPVAKPVEKPKPDPKKIAEEKERREERRKAAAEKVEKQKQASARAAAKAASADNGRGTAEKKTAAGVQGARNGAAKRGGEGGGASVSSWIGKVNARLLRLQSRARVRDFGQAGVRFAFNDSGSITSVTVVRSSGNPKVDDAAVALIRKASPIPAPPDGAPRSHTITIQFR